jgi:hypothetical protein
MEIFEEHLSFDKVSLRDVHAIQRFLLDHPEIDLSQSDFAGTALHHAVASTDEVLEALALDPRTSGTALNFGGASPFWCACLKGELKKTKILMAVKKETPLKQRMGFTQSTSREVAEQRGHAEIVSLLDRFATSPEKVRQELEVELGFCFVLFCFVLF